jgi:hypothetical protein
MYCLSGCHITGNTGIFELYAASIEAITLYLAITKLAQLVQFLFDVIQDDSSYKILRYCKLLYIKGE